MAGVTASVPRWPIMRVWPSGAARAAASAPIEPAAPGRLSITTGWPSPCARLSPSAGAGGAGEDVGRASWRERDDQSDRTRWIILGGRQRGEEQRGDRGNEFQHGPILVPCDS